MIQKIIKVGNSAAVVIPKEFLKTLDASVGNTVNLKLQPEKKRVIIEISQEKENEGEIIDREVYAVAKDLLRRYLPAFKELAKR